MKVSMPNSAITYETTDANVKEATPSGATEALVKEVNSVTDVFYEELLESPKVTYVVQAGDTLSSIAKKYGMDWQTLYENNKDVIGSNPNVILVGQELVISVEETLTENVEEPVSLEEASPTVSENQSRIAQSKSALTLAGYEESIHTKRQASESVKATAGTITTDNQIYVVVPDSEYQKLPGTISESDYHLMIAQVAGESANSKDDMLGVATTMLNRLESSNNFGSSILEVLEKGYFPWGRTYLKYVEGGSFYNTEAGQKKLAEATEAVNDALRGARNLESNVYYYSGDGTYNYFSDIL